MTGLGWSEDKTKRMGEGGFGRPFFSLSTLSCRNFSMIIKKPGDGLCF